MGREVRGHEAGEADHQRGHREGEGINRTAQLFAEHPNEGYLSAYVLRLFALLLILSAILKKNYGNRN